MAINLESWKKYSDSNLYNTMSDSDKKIWWDYGYNNGLVPTHRLNDKTKAEMNKYVSGTYNTEYVQKTKGYDELGQKVLKEDTDKFKSRVPLTGGLLKPVVAEPKIQMPDFINKPKQIAAQVSKGVTSDSQFKNVNTTLKVKQSQPTKPMSNIGFSSADLKQPKVDVKGIQATSEAKQKEKDKFKQDVKQAKVDFKRLQQAIIDEPNVAKKIELTKQLEVARRTKDANIDAVLRGATFGLSEEKNKVPEIRASAERAKAQTKPYEVLGALGSQAALYSTLTPALAATNIGKKILGGAGASAIRQFSGKQAIDFVTDVAIQSPIEVINAVSNNKTLDQGAKDLAKNLAFGALFNGVVGGVIDRKLLSKALSDVDISRLLKSKGIGVQDVVKAVDSGDRVAIESIRDIIYVNPQGGASPSLAKAQMPLDIPSGKLALPEPKVVSNMEIPTPKTELKTTKLNDVVVTKDLEPDGFENSISRNADGTLKNINGLVVNTSKVNLKTDLKDYDDFKQFYDYGYELGSKSSKYSNITDYKYTYPNLPKELNLASENAFSSGTNFDIVKYDEAIKMGFADGQSKDHGRSIKFVIGERIGAVPKSRLSKNFREGYEEKGVSILGYYDNGVFYKQNDSSYEMFNPGEKHYVFGMLNKNAKGADGEPLLLYAVDLGDVSRGIVSKIKQPVKTTKFDFSPKLTKEVPRTITPGQSLLPTKQPVLAKQEPTIPRYQS